MAVSQQKISALHEYHSRAKLESKSASPASTLPIRNTLCLASIRLSEATISAESSKQLAKAAGMRSGTSPLAILLRESDAACLTTITRTAADALFNLLGYPLPDEDGKLQPGPLLIWGGSASLGIAAIQFAKAIGVSPILVTASLSQHRVLVELGAHEWPDIVRSPTWSARFENILLTQNSN